MPSAAGRRCWWWGAFPASLFADVEPDGTQVYEQRDGDEQERDDRHGRTQPEPEVLEAGDVHEHWQAVDFARRGHPEQHEGERKIVDVFELREQGGREHRPWNV